jgi:hypothetical protein
MASLLFSWFSWSSSSVFVVLLKVRWRSRERVTNRCLKPYHQGQLAFQILVILCFRYLLTSVFYSFTVTFLLWRHLNHIETSLFRDDDHMPDPWSTKSVVKEFPACPFPCLVTTFVGKIYLFRLHIVHSKGIKENH